MYSANESTYESGMCFWLCIRCDYCLHICWSYFRLVFLLSLLLLFIFENFSLCFSLGAHINPAITIAFSVIGKFQWRKVPVYLIAQYIGSFIGSALAYSIYFEAIHGFDLDNGYNNDNITEPSMITAGIFITMPANQHTTILPAIWDQIISTALLVYAILFIGDELATPKLLQTLTTGLLILTFIIGFNYNCGAILNPGM